MSGKITVPSVAPHLSRVRDAAEMVVLDQGGVQDWGCHNVLMRRGALAAALWQRQVVQKVQ